MSMTDEQIVMALECCGNMGNCKEQCPFGDFGGIDKCIHSLMLYALDLIKRQQEEIEKYRKANERLQGNLAILLNNKDDREIEWQKNAEEARNLITAQGQLIEQLKAENDALVKENAKSILKGTELIAENNLLKMGKAEAVREFAEFLIDKAENNVIRIGDLCDYVIDFNEMTEKEGGKG